MFPKKVTLFNREATDLFRLPLKILFSLCNLLMMAAVFADWSRSLFKSVSSECRKSDRYLIDLLLNVSQVFFYLVDLVYWGIKYVYQPIGSFTSPSHGMLCSYECREGKMFAQQIFRMLFKIFLVFHREPEPLVLEWTFGKTISFA